MTTLIDECKKLERTIKRDREALERIMHGLRNARDLISAENNDQALENIDKLYGMTELALYRNKQQASGQVNK